MANESESGGVSESDRERIRKEIQEEIASLGQKVAHILHPDIVELRPCATLVFGPPNEREGPRDPAMVRRYERAVELAVQAPKYWTEGEGKYLRHYACFELEHAKQLFELYQTMCDLPEGEVLIYDLPLPFSRDLWLPLFWFHRV